MNRLYLMLLLSAFYLNIFAQSSADKRLSSYHHRLELQKNSLLKNVELKNIGPTIMSGRVVDIAVNPDNPSVFYVAYASGGLWKTTNNGNTFFPLFDDQPSMTIGDIAVDWKHGEAIWVGTGESNSSRSSYAGTGIYKSLDTGKTWIHLGLDQTHRTGRIILHPDNINIAWVGSIGHLYTTNSERGVYKTTDGGKSWRQTLYINDTTGVIDLAADPSNLNILYAAAWYRSRSAWNFTESGNGSGIYKSKDGGENWQLLSSASSGFPIGQGVGRIGLAVYDKDPNIIFALLDNQNRREEIKTEDSILAFRKKLKTISKEDFIKLEENLINEFLDEQDFPAEYTAKKIIEMVKEGKIKPSDLVEYLEDANALLFDSPVIGAEVYKSNDAGLTWKKVNEKYIDAFYYSYGYYFGGIAIEPGNENRIYILGVPILASDEGGKSFKSVDNDNVHADHHAIWINPKNLAHIIIGNDGGLNMSYDYGKTWSKLNAPAVGQFYSVAVDMDTPFNVYGGLQDNGVWKGPSDYKYSSEWQQSGLYPYKMILGGDGMQVAIDTTNNKTVYTGYQFGFYYRFDSSENDPGSVKPIRKLGESPLRFNWQTPVQLSSHNPDIFYLGSNKLHRSLDKGEHYEIISDDLTKGGIKGDVPYGTLTSISESPLKFGLIYTGSDDGVIHITTDGGGNWRLISNKLPQNLWVSRVTASAHDTGTVYVSLNGYRTDNFESFVYRSTDFGMNWERIGLDLPFEPVNVIKEDPVNKNILYTGTDNGLYVSLDAGKTFMALFNGMPHAPVHDIAIQSRDKKLLAATHGRSIYIADIQHIQQLNTGMIQKPVHLFPPATLTYNPGWGNKDYEWDEISEPELKLVYYSNIDAPASINITTDENNSIAASTDSAEHGLNYFTYNLAVDKKNEDSYKDFVHDELKLKDNFKETLSKKLYLRPGKYKAIIEINGKKETQGFEIKEQPKKKRE